ncbi:universal stress protein [Streptomyces mangrovisoli]|uniref:Universal stress protein n=1 Tax=Streptomyces mangrovisoli TaxID=1428628 RepID=A0A1J4P5B9_9ACTN|nr:universal stress protein [Streptomyces mangrovisoli]
MELPLVVGVDGSEAALRATDWAADAAARWGVPLRVVHADLWERYEGSLPAEHADGDTEDEDARAEAVRAEDVVDAAARRARLRRPGLKVGVGVLPEEPEYALVHEGNTAAAVVVGSRGRGGVAELLLGSVSLTVAAHARCPVIVVRGGRHPVDAGQHGRIVVAVGEDSAETPAVRFAYDEARRRGVPLEAVRVWRCPAHETTDHPLLAGEPARLHEKRAAEELDAALAGAPADLVVHRRTVEGPPRQELVALSREADLLVVGARRRDAPFGLQLGRVAHALLHHAACPVAVVPQRV